VQAENQLLKVELAELEAELSTHRDNLTHAKHDRDSLRSENLRLRGEAGLIGEVSPPLRSANPPLRPAAPPAPPVPERLRTPRGAPRANRALRRPLL
jgi:hypothetical protein